MRAHPIPEKPQVSTLPSPEPPPRRARRQIRQRRDDLTPPQPQHRAAQQEQRDIRPHLCRYAKPVVARSVPCPAPAPAPATPPPHSLSPHPDRPAPAIASRYGSRPRPSRPSIAQCPLRHLPRGIARVVRHALVVRGEHETRCRGRAAPSPSPGHAAQSSGRPSQARDTHPAAPDQLPNRD